LYEYDSSKLYIMLDGTWKWWVGLRLRTDGFI
jgi:hypothetical protein